MSETFLPLSKPVPDALPSTIRRALVVEDDPGIRMLVSTVLTREGFLALSAANGREAIALLNGGTFSLIVLDLTMPEVSGIELIEYLRQRDEQLLRRVVVITASVPRARPVLPDEICHVVTKPFDLADFRAVVAACAADA